MIPAQKLFRITKQILNNTFLARHFSSGLPGIIKNDDFLEINFESGTEQFPIVWLRDNCRCDKCYHKASNSRIINWNAFNIDVKIKSIEKQCDGEISVNWDDDHKSTYKYDWLKQRSFSKNAQQKYLTDIYRPSRSLWNKHSFSEVLQTYNYEEVNSNNKQLYKWLNDLCKFGVVLLENTPIDQKELANFANKIAYVRKTHYGEDYHIKNKPDTQNVAYLNSTLQMHTDIPYYHYTPGVTLLHCLVQSESTKGGDNLLVDAFNVADKLKKEQNEIFNILSTTDVQWFDVGVEDGVKFHTIFRAPMICLNSHGNIEIIRHSIPQRDSYFTIDLNDVKPWYKALNVFIKTIHEEVSYFRFKPGDILAFDNTRIIHGRSAYEDTEKHKRFLVGIYIDWDDVYSKLRMLKNELNI